MTTAPRYFRLLAPVLRDFTGRQPILMYHKVARPRRDARLKGLYISRELFQRQMQQLRAAQFTSLPPGAPATRIDDAHARAITISFDDGFVNTLENALPALREFRFTGIQFLVADSLGKNNSWDVAAGDCSEPLMGVAQVKEWLAGGQQIGSHTLSHPRLSQIPLADARREIFDSKKKLEDTFGVSIEHFCYPYGDFNAAVRELVGEAGYQTACTVENGFNPPDADRLALKRILVRHKRPGWLARAAFLPSRYF